MGALNSIELKCESIEGIEKLLQPHPGHNGKWGEYLKCNDSFANGVEIEIYDNVRGDDRGATNFALTCCDRKRLEGSNMDYEHRGKWKGVQSCTKGMAICGIRVRMEKNYGHGLLSLYFIRSCNTIFVSLLVH